MADTPCSLNIHCTGSAYSCTAKQVMAGTFLPIALNTRALNTSASDRAHSVSGLSATRA